MEILVLAKQVPETAEADLEITRDGADVEREDLVYTINEWDNYAVEEAVRLKEEHGGAVMILTLGDEESEDVLRRGLAMGCDQAIHLNDEAFLGSDPASVVKAMVKALGERRFDLILAGVQSADQGQGQTGVLLAQALDLSYATLVVGLKLADGGLVVTRELEANTLEEVTLPLPALVTVQSGINQPRYVSIMGIRKVRGMAIEAHDAEGLDLVGEVGSTAACLAARRLALPEAGTGAEILAGSLEAVCARAAGIIREKGGLK